MILKLAEACSSLGSVAPWLLGIECPPPWSVLIVDMLILKEQASVQTALESSNPLTEPRRPLASTLDLQILGRRVVWYNVLLARFQWSKQGMSHFTSAGMLAQEDLSLGTWPSSQSTSSLWTSTYVRNAGPFNCMQIREQSRIYRALPRS
jgi:hypothetical protein